MNVAIIIARKSSKRIKTKDKPIIKFAIKNDYF